MPDKCVCGVDATVPVAQLGDTFQRAAVAMYRRCPTFCTTCFHIILKSGLPALHPTPSVLPQDLMGSLPTVPQALPLVMPLPVRQTTVPLPVCQTTVPPRPGLKTHMQSLHLCIDKSSRLASLLVMQLALWMAVLWPFLAGKVGTHVLVRVVIPSSMRDMTRWLAGGPSGKSASVSMELIHHTWRVSLSICRCTLP